MANTPDFATFARFRDLNVKSLLYYQAELTSLRQQLHRIEWRDHRIGTFPHSGDLTENLNFLILSEFSETKTGQRQMKLVRKMRGLLKEYSES
jgi:hypothetical protein